MNVRRHAWQRKRWHPAGRRPSFFTLAERQRGQCGILIPSQRKQYQQRGASLAHCNFAVSAGKLEPWKFAIEADVVRRAVQIGLYLVPHARYAFPHARYALAFMGSDPSVEDAKYILRWIESGVIEHFSKRDAWQGTKGRFANVAELEPGLDLLEAHGYIREDPNQPQRRGPGRKPSPRYEVNPYVFKVETPSQNSHNFHNTPGDPILGILGTAQREKMPRAGAIRMSRRNLPPKPTLGILGIVGMTRGWSFDGGAK